MPNVRAADKEIISVYLPRTLAMRLRRKARELKYTLTDLCISIFTRETQAIELTPEDYEAIARATREATASGKGRSTPHPHSKRNKSAPRKGGDRK